MNHKHIARLIEALMATLALAGPSAFSTGAIARYPMTVDARRRRS
jgi:hypothetical protein